MTAVVGLRGSRGTLLAGDTYGTAPGWGDTRDREDAKTFSLSETVAIAYCGSYRMGQILKYNLTLPDIPVGLDPHEWAVKYFIPTLRASFEEHGFLHAESGVQTIGRHSSFILGVRNRLFTVQSDLQVSEDSYPWVADGSGFQAVAGHLRGMGFTEEIIPDNRNMLSIARGALATAADLNAYVGNRTTHVRTVAYTNSEVKRAREIAEMVGA